MRVLVIDDEKNIRTTLAVCLEASGCQVTAVATGEAALAAMSQTSFDLALLDLRLGSESGIDLLPRLLAESPSLAVVLITAYATVASAVEALERGAADYLQKPFTPEQIRHVVAKVAERRAADVRLAELAQELQDAVPEIDFHTTSAKMRAALETVARAAASDVAVLLRGENGTGKGVLARFLHVKSPRRDRPLVVVNCPTLSQELLASELFGHTQGSFTGAVRDQPGRVEAAEGGTLFLDEVAEVSPGLQAKLLRFLQDKQFERLGELRTRRADVRIVAATNHDLEADVVAGHFRQDLLYRLNVVEVNVPPLRERPEDIVPLARRFLAFFARAAGRPTQDLSPSAEKLLADYPWPGNVRELRNTMERAAILWPAKRIEPAAFPERMLSDAGVGPRLGGDATLAEIEREHVLRVVARAATLEEAARILGIDSSTLYRKRRQYDGES
ncbi:MAG TPA: sigma-54 dependent transcriptional regulator [Pirellulales bacterium]|jgi:NtrC-family two-component system response regulator AlgB|nr:sigma-54 dependent transcriptional regulator [Pirellulales bacterium]